MSDFDKPVGEDPASKGVGKSQPVPKATVPDKAETNINEEMALFHKEFQLRADERNDGRKWYDKLLGRKKVTVKDIAHEEALRMNQRVDTVKEKSDGGKDALASKSVEKAEFGHEDTATIEGEEMVRKYAPDLVKALEEGDFSQAKKAGDKLLSRVFKDDKEERLVKMGVKKLLDQRVEMLVLSGDSEKMRELVGVYKPYEIGLKTLAKIPKEIIQLPNVQASLSNNINYAIVNRNATEDGKKTADKYVRLGLMTADGVAKVINSLEVQESLSNNINYAIVNRNASEDGKKTADKYVRLGLMTADGVAKVINSPEVQERLSQNISLPIINRGDSKGAKGTADGYVRLGFMTRIQADKIIADASARR